MPSTLQVLFFGEALCAANCLEGRTASGDNGKPFRHLLRLAQGASLAATGPGLLNVIQHGLKNRVWDTLAKQLSRAVCGMAITVSRTEKRITYKTYQQ